MNRCKGKVPDTFFGPRHRPNLLWGHGLGSWQSSFFCLVGIRGNRRASNGSGINAFGEGGCYDCWKPRQFMASARIHGKRVTGSCPTQFATPDTNRSGSGDAKLVDSGWEAFRGYRRKSLSSSVGPGRLSREQSLAFQSSSSAHRLPNVVPTSPRDSPCQVKWRQSVGGRRGAANGLPRPWAGMEKEASVPLSMFGPL